MISLDDQVIYFMLYQVRKAESNYEGDQKIVFINLPHQGKATESPETPVNSLLLHVSFPQNMYHNHNYVQKYYT